MSSETKFTSYRWCIVPMCKNTSSKTTGKVFVQIPKDQRREFWFKAIGRDYESISKTSNVFVCEDHFDLQNDMENYMKWKLTGGVKRMKKTVIPHKFDCQMNRKRISAGASGSAAVKRTRLIEDSLGSSTKSQSDPVPGLYNMKVEGCDASVSHSLKPEVFNKEIGITARPYIRSKKVQTVLLMNSIEGLNSPISISGLPSTELKVIASVKEQDISKLAVDHTTRIVNSNPMHYIGLQEESMFIIDLVEEFTHLDTISILMTLQKIRLSQAFCELGDAYGLSESAASRKFSKSVILISELMREVIIWPPREKIQEQLPLLFRAHYRRVQCIIHCFEIKIQKPTDTVKQFLTWSEYKKANTLKYLVSSTPDGVVNFISSAFGGSTSDALIVEKSGFLDRLQPGALIMADQGFTDTENLFIQKQCTLLRPPISKLDKIHLETKVVITRLREFTLLKSYSRVSSELIPYMNFIIVIACGLINLQGPIVNRTLE